MLYASKYCNNCGEKLVQEQGFNLLRSKLYCALCQTEYQLQEWIPKIGVFLLSIFGLWGIGTVFFARSPKSPNIAVRQQENSAIAAQARQNSDQNAVVSNDKAKLNALKSANTESAPVVSNSAVSQALPSVNASQQKTLTVESDAYYCGAATKKGTPCTRKVKGPVRCWQHAGQSSVLKQNELKVP